MLEQNLVSHIDSSLSFQTDEDGRFIKWFYCFGTLLEFIRSAGKKLCMEQDIDIGVMYGESPPQGIIRSFEGMNYKINGMILSDVTKEPLNIHFAAPKEMKGTPNIDIFFWVLKHNRLYHTYDYYKEGKEYPKKYHFKGVDHWLINPSKDIIKATQEKSRDRIMTDKGVWMYDIFGDHSGYRFMCPYAYGTLLDIWYSQWLIPDRNYGQSSATYVKEVRSCSEL